METKLNYFGYDIDEVFLSLAKRTFPDNADKFTNLDIEKENPAATDVTVCSATFEHLDNPEECLKKMLRTTSKIMILRSFFGNKTIKYVQGCNHLVVNPYNINQFNLFDIGKMFFENGFNFWCIKDNATGSEPKEIYESDGSGGGTRTPDTRIMIPLL